MRKVKCHLCSFSATEADRAWDAVASSGRCPECGAYMEGGQLIAAATELHKPSSSERAYSSGNNHSNYANEVLSSNLSVESIEFWRHIVGAMLVALVSPPYFSIATIGEFLGYSLGKIFVALVLAGILTFLRWLFFTNTLKGKVYSFFVMSMWVFLLLGISLQMYVQR